MSEDEPDSRLIELTRAYEERGEQLYEASGALAEAVSTITAELNHCRQERDRAQAEIEGLRAHVEALEGEIDKLGRYVVQIQDEARIAHEQVRAFQDMRVIRWSARPRAILQRVRGLGL
jgi:peptidoglycan hydrolase CwlO-like protein